MYISCMKSTNIEFTLSVIAYWNGAKSSIEVESTEMHANRIG